jgi:ACS family D-galactonate transporter-like MFS transporter
MNTTVAAASTTRTRISASALNLIVVLTVAQAIAYVDRVNLSAVTPVLIRTYHFQPSAVGALFSIFNGAYTLALIPAGPFVDRVRGRVGYFFGVSLWSIGTILCGLTTSFTSLALFRGLVGVGEAPLIPAGQLIISETFPRESRAAAIGSFFAGNKIGLALGIPFAAFTFHALGLAWMFYLTGALGIIWLAWFALSYRHAPPALAQSARGGANWGTLLRSRQVWGIMLGQACYLFVYYLYASWLPEYLVRERHFTVLHSGYFALVPFGLGFLATIAGGWASDQLIASGMRVTISRKVFACGGLLLATIFTLVTTFATTTAVAVVGLTISVLSFSLATGAIQSMAVDISPKHLVSSIVSLQMFGGNVGGTLAGIIPGILIQRSGHFEGVMLLTAGIALAGCVFYALLAGNLDRELRAPAA